MADLNEQGLLQKAQNGDTEAFDEIVQLYLPRIYRLCFNWTGHQQDAEDCTQESFLKAYRALANYRGQSSFYTWLYRIAANTCHDFHRSKKNQTFVFLDQTFGEDEQPVQLADQGFLPDEIAINHELGVTLCQSIQQLNEPMRDVLILRDVEGFSYGEIAQLLKISEGTVKSRLFRGRGQVVRTLQREQISQESRHIQQGRVAP
ncbi:MAG: sigma-70 family RNA polymerase sigma factor [Eubacteriales bacterium]|nr:sigma-70 family RNA polymerase sigma factor [Eubacteriales bacterium]